MRSLPLLLSFSLAASFLPYQPLLAETTCQSLPNNGGLELELLTNPKNGVVTANTINQTELTIPSLWWAKDNTENKLLDNWIVYAPTENTTGRVDALVNQQVWSPLDYLERFNFINTLGRTVNYSENPVVNIASNKVNKTSSDRKCGYNVRVFNYRQEILATYSCNFNSIPAQCKITIDR